MWRTLSKIDFLDLILSKLTWPLFFYGISPCSIFITNLWPPEDINLIYMAFTATIGFLLHLLCYYKIFLWSHRNSAVFPYMFWGSGSNKFCQITSAFCNRREITQQCIYKIPDNKESYSPCEIIVCHSFSFT